jgi:hypothetical protein
LAFQETVTKTQFYEMEGILHKQTGEILTFVEAIRQGLLDLSSGGEFFDIVSGSRVSLDKAVSRSSHYLFIILCTYLTLDK